MSMSAQSPRILLIGLEPCLPLAPPVNGVRMALGAALQTGPDLVWAAGAEG